MSEKPTTKFYGRRKGRPIKPQASQLMETLLPQLAIDSTTFPLSNLNQLFETHYPRYGLEIGFGGGEHLAQIAEENPDMGFIGCEPFMNGVASLLKMIDERQLKNIRLWTEDARLLLDQIPQNSFDKIILLFTDPWPKKRHHSRRLITQDFLKHLATLMTSKGELRIAHDHADYIEWIVTRLKASSEFEIIEMTHTHPESWPMTRYEQKALEKGIECTYLRSIPIRF